MSATTKRKAIDWSRWLHDPRHWERFYDDLGIKTYAAIAKAICDGERPEEAVDAAVEAISAQMRRAGIPAALVRSYREDYFRHRDQLVEVAGEIWDVLPAGAAEGCAAAADGGNAGLAGWAGMPVALFLGACEGMMAMMAGFQHEAWEWSRLLASSIEHGQVEHRHAGGPCDEAPLTAHYGRRTHDVDVERL